MLPVPYGATASRPEETLIAGVIGSGMMIWLQWSHSLSAMETSSSDRPSRTCRTASMEPQPFGHGNHHAAHRVGILRHASMEPQPFGHGNPRRKSERLAGRTPASMEPQPFGHGNRGTWPGTTGRSGCFNGATAFRPWKPPLGHDDIKQVITLQWSHSLSAMETLSVIIIWEVK